MDGRPLVKCEKRREVIRAGSVQCIAGSSAPVVYPTFVTDSSIKSLSNEGSSLPFIDPSVFGTRGI